jgi:hypothetical protein
VPWGLAERDVAIDAFDDDVGAKRSRVDRAVRGRRDAFRVHLRELRDVLQDGAEIADHPLHLGFRKLELGEFRHVKDVVAGNRHGSGARGDYVCALRDGKSERGRPDHALQRFSLGTTISLALAHSERKLLPETVRHEIAIDDELGRPPAEGPSWITPVVLFLGLVLTVVLFRIGVYFFFLPIILPFGLGGGRLFRHFFPAPRRVLRLQEGLFWLVVKAAWKTTTLGRLDVSRGASVTVATTAPWAGGNEEAHLRVAAAEGVLTVPVRGIEHARKLQRLLTELFEAAGIPLLEGDA